MTSTAAAVVLVVVIIVGSFLLVVAWQKRAHGYDELNSNKTALILFSQFPPNRFSKGIFGINEVNLFSEVG